MGVAYYFLGNKKKGSGVLFWGPRKGPNLENYRDGQGCTGLKGFLKRSPHPRLPPPSPDSARKTGLQFPRVMLIILVTHGNESIEYSNTSNTSTDSNDSNDTTVNDINLALP